MENRQVTWAVPVLGQELLGREASAVVGPEECVSVVARRGRRLARLEAPVFEASVLAISYGGKRSAGRSSAHTARPTCE
jgi:hypothetical protein